jgi:hypothetical protein
MILLKLEEEAMLVTEADMTRYLEIIADFEEYPAKNGEFMTYRVPSHLLCETCADFHVAPGLMERLMHRVRELWHDDPAGMAAVLGEVASHHDDPVMMAIYLGEPDPEFIGDMMDSVGVQWPEWKQSAKPSTLPVQIVAGGRL